MKMFWKDSYIYAKLLNFRVKKYTLGGAGI
jgi:hypothetical protein